MNKETQIAYLRAEFLDYYNQLSRVSLPMMNKIESGLGHKSDFRAAEELSHRAIKGMYFIICAYLELKGYPQFLSSFKESFQDVVSDKELSTEIISVVISDDDYEIDFALITEWRTFLAPFDLFTDPLNEIELNRIIRVLNGTKEILSFGNVQIKNEISINNAIREYLKIYYKYVSGYIDGYFVSEFKTYHPDIIMKDIGVSIEYKLIKTDNDIPIKIDELIVDASSYKGNHHNKWCIAVFCLCSAVSTPKDQIIDAWEQRNFPDNWRLVIVEGIHIHTTLKKSAKKTP